MRLGHAGTPVKYLARDVRELNLDLSENNLLSLSYGRIIRKDIDSNEGLLPASFDRYTKVRPGDTVMRLTDLQNDQRSLRTGLVTQFGIITSAYLTLRPSESVDARYLSYSLHAIDTAKSLYALGGGLRQSMGMEEVGNLRLNLPSIVEQRRIADFLDNQVARIDAVVALRKEQLAVLDEVGMHVLADAALALWPSEVSREAAWFPSYQPGWQMLRVSWVAKCLDAMRVPLSAVEREGRAGTYPYFGASTIVDYLDDYIFDEELVLVGEDGGALTNLRFDVVQEVSGKIWVNNHAHVLRAVGVESAYLAAVLRCVDRPILLSGSTRPKITQDDLMSLRVPVPPSADRNAMLALAQQMRAGITDKRNRLLRAGELLEEYKRSLITAAVTGEFDVSAASGRGVPA